METKRLRLEPPSMRYQPLMLQAIIESKNQLGEYLPWVRHALTEEESKQDTIRSIRDFECFENEQRYSLIEKESGSFVGVIGLMIRDKTVPFFEVGYWLRSSFVGRGFATEAVKALETHAFNELSANRLEIRVAERNVKSRAVAESCGYMLEGVLLNERRLPSGELDNTIIYAKSTL
ncbi:GNAT family N-acetyltransferase [Vibrio sp. WXL103]|uniref:GNAT family N-acetyltransferase n=1 Tax=unclassified Vibrio TaxID=2614977 RepID=UPI003EC57DE0